MSQQNVNYLSCFFGVFDSRMGVRRDHILLWEAVVYGVAVRVEAYCSEFGRRE